MTRSSALDAIASGEPWDVIVIGGGASGFGAAVDAASRGFRTLLVEQGDFGKGTSSRSTKLVHGGVRYLQQGRVGLVRESLHERGLLLRNAPHVTRPLPFIVPSYRWSDSLLYGVGLKAYDLLAGKLGLGPSTLLSAAQIQVALPNISSAGLRGGVQYFDGQFDDARLIVTLARTLFSLGGIALNYAPVHALLKKQDRISGVVIRDAETSREYSISGRAVISATGVFTDDLRHMDQPETKPVIVASQGSHIVVDRSFLPARAALMIPKTTDGRVLFAIPWLNHLLIGTTDIPSASIHLEPRPAAQEIAFILENAGRYLASPPRQSDIRSVFAGLRPLVRPAGARRTADISRDFSLLVSASGLISLTGGKWTTFRRMGQAAVDRAIQVAGLERRQSRSATLRLHGAIDAPSRDFDHLSVYGLDIQEMKRSGPATLLHSRLPFTEAQVIWAARHEMACTVEDVLARRTRMLFLDAAAAIASAARVASILGAELGRDSEWQQRQVAGFATLARQYLP